MKIIDVLGRSAGSAAIEPASVLGVTAAGDSPCRVEVNVVDPDSMQLSKRQWNDADVSIAAIVMRWYPDGSTPPRLEPDGLEHLWTLTVAERLAVGERSSAEEPGAVKHIAFLRRAVPPDQFIVAYRHHVELVAEHLPGIRRYVQNEVQAGTYVGRPIDAVSELTFSSADAHARRWARGRDSEREFRVSETFLDLAAAFQVACVEHVMSLEGR